MIRPVALFALAVLTLGAISATPARAEGDCKTSDNYDEAKGLCYIPNAASKPDMPKGENPTGSWGISQATNKPYPAGR